MRKLLLSLGIFVLAGLSSPASMAHGQIVSSFPEQYSNASPIPSQVWIEFDGALQTLDGQMINTVEVIDSTGLTVSFGDPTIAGGKISSKISGQSAAGVFTVNYRVVGQDGHPVEGSYTFNASPDYAAYDAVTTSEEIAVSSKKPLVTISLAVLILVGISLVVLRRRGKK